MITFGRWSVIKNLMTLIGHNTSAKWEDIRSENLKKMTTTTADRGLYENLLSIICENHPCEIVPV